MNSSSNDNETRVAVVTGAAGDMGAAVASSFVAAGWHVLAADVREVEPQPGLTPMVADVAEPGAVRGLADAAVAQGALRVWVNCAGIVAACRIADADIEAWNRIIAVNLTGTFNGCAAALEAMDGGAIVNVGSLSGQIGGLGMHPAYGASKAGVHALTKSYALEGAKRGIRCNAVAPSVIDGSMASALDPKQRAMLEKMNPMRRLGEMHEVVEAVRFLADDTRAGYINGVVLPINGGSFMP